MPFVDTFAVLSYFVSGAVYYLVIGGTGYLAWRFVRAYERRSAEAPQLYALSRRVDSLEAAVETVEAQVRETAEAQRFTTGLLIGRARGHAKAGRE